MKDVEPGFSRRLLSDFTSPIRPPADQLSPILSPDSLPPPGTEWDQTPDKTTNLLLFSMGLFDRCFLVEETRLGNLLLYRMRRFWHHMFGRFQDFGIDLASMLVKKLWDCFGIHLGQAFTPLAHMLFIS